MRRAILVIGVAAALIGTGAPTSAAAIIRMKSGAKVEGTIIRQDERQVVIDLGGGRWETVPKSGIAAIAPSGSTQSQEAAPGTPRATTAPPVPAQGPSGSPEYQEMMKRMQVSGQPPPWQEVRKTPEWQALNAKLVGPDGKPHPQEGLSIDMIESNYWYMGLSEEQRRDIQKTLEQRSSDEIVDQLRARAQLRVATGEYAGAAADMKERVAIEEKKFGPTSPMLAPDLDYYGDILIHLGKTQEGEAMKARAKTLHPQR